MKIWQKTLVGFGVVVALVVPTGIAVAATDGGAHGRGGCHDGYEMMDSRGGHGSMDMVGHHDGTGPAGMGHAGMVPDTTHGDMGGPMGGSAPAR